MMESSSQVVSSAHLSLLHQPIFHRLDDQLHTILNEGHVRQAEVSRKLLRGIILRHAMIAQPLMRQYIVERILQISEQRGRFLQWLETSVTNITSRQNKNNNNNSSKQQQQLTVSSSSSGSALPTTFAEWHEACMGWVVSLDALHCIALEDIFQDFPPNSTIIAESTTTSTNNTAAGEEVFVCFEDTLSSAMAVLLMQQATSAQLDGSSPMEQFIRRKRNSTVFHGTCKMAEVQKATVEVYLNSVLDRIGNDALLAAASMEEEDGPTVNNIESTTEDDTKLLSEEGNGKKTKKKLWKLVEALAQRVALREAVEWLRKEPKLCVMLPSRGSLSVPTGPTATVSCPAVMLSTPTSLLHCLLQFYKTMFLHVATSSSTSSSAASTSQNAIRQAVDQLLALPVQRGSGDTNNNSSQRTLSGKKKARLPLPIASYLTLSVIEPLVESMIGLDTPEGTQMMADLRQWGA